MQNLAAGPSLQATGVITANTASLLSFGSVQGVPLSRSLVYLSNTSGVICYFKLNDKGLTVSPTNWDVVIPPVAGIVLIVFRGIRVESVSVYASVISGINVVGW